MAITTKGFTGSVNQTEFAKILAGAMAFGIRGTYNGGQFVASRVPGSRTVSVTAGDVEVPGVTANMSTTTSPTASAANATGSNRIDTLVMRFDWAGSGSATLMILEGGGSPPALESTPGTKFDVPLYRLTLVSGAADYLVANIKDQRVWLVDGHLVQPSTSLAPALPIGRGLYQPDAGRWLIQGATELDTIRAWEDTGSVDLGVSAPVGYSGAMFGRRINGWAQINLLWTHTAAADTTEHTPNVVLPIGWRPTEVDSPQSGWVDNKPLRFIAYRNGNLSVGPVQVPHQSIIRATLAFITEPQPEDN